MRYDLMPSELPADDDHKVLIGERELVVSGSSGCVVPGATIGVHANWLSGQLDRPLDFDLELATTDEHGSPRSVLHRESVTSVVGALQTWLLELRLPDQAPAFYRLTVSVRLGARQETRRTYLFVPEQTLDAELRIAQRIAHPGQELRYRIINHGPTTLQFGVDYELERAANDRWENHNVEQLWELVGLGLRAGGELEQTALLPANAPAGRYRIRKQVSAFGTRLTTTLADEFTLAD